MSRRTGSWACDSAAVTRVGELFERPSTYPLKPDRVYVDSVPGGTPIDLWPLAAVSLCPECRTRELFLLNQARDESLILRSLEEHQLEIAYAEPEWVPTTATGPLEVLATFTNRRADSRSG